jgi:hypothetical protein
MGTLTLPTFGPVYSISRFGKIQYLHSTPSGLTHLFFRIPQVSPGAIQIQPFQGCAF